VDLLRGIGSQLQNSQGLDVGGLIQGATEQLGSINQTLQGVLGGAGGALQGPSGQAQGNGGGASPGGDGGRQPAPAGVGEQGAKGGEAGSPPSGSPSAQGGSGLSPDVVAQLRQIMEQLQGQQGGG